MIVLVLTACPEGLRGHLTRWLSEVSAGVFVGSASARVREHLWDRVEELVGNGRALLVYSARTEQGFALRSHGHHWSPEDFEGITLMRRPTDEQEPESAWGASRRYRVRRGRV